MRGFAMQLGWTDERVTLLKALWADGQSAQQIATELGGELSRNAVLGKIHRLGLSVSRPPKPKRAPVARRRKWINTTGSTMMPMPEPNIPKAPRREAITAAEIPVSQRKALLDLETQHCRWPYGTPGEADFFFCGSPTANLPERPYCPAHANLSTAPRQTRAPAKVVKLDRERPRFNFMRMTAA